MPKPISLTAGLVEAPQMTPQASTPARKPKATPAAKVEQMPLQVRWPRSEVRAVKVAAEMCIRDSLRGWEGWLVLNRRQGIWNRLHYRSQEGQDI